MTSFLDLLTDAIHPKVSSNSLIVVPTRRAAVQIQRKLGAKQQKPGFLPTCIPIADLMSLCNDLPIASDTTLLLDLFHSYKNYDSAIQLDEFIKWGDQLLSDFDEVDRNLIDPEKLFTRIKDIKDIEEMFADDEVETELLNRFWKEFSMNPLSKLKLSFLSYWEILPKLYVHFTKSLIDKKYCYEGMAWRNVASTLESNKWFNHFDHIVFAGFYALTKSEEVIISTLVKNNKASIYIDADEYYINQKLHEAGNYFRKGINQSIKNFIGNDLTTSAKTIRIIQSNGAMSMAKDLGFELIERFENKPAEELSNAVVVLPDDKLLLPLLQILDKRNIPYNPSMGMALSAFPILSFIKKIKSIRIQLSNTEQNTDSILNSLFEFKSFSSLFLTTQNTIDDLKNSLLLPTANFKEEQNFLLNLLSQFSIPNIRYQKQVFNCILNEIKLFFNLIERYDDNLSITSYWTLLINHLNKVRIPIEANEGEGVNINGFLETRLTDYSDVYIANLNEGVLPSNAISNTLIPYAIRKFYSLPCKEEKESVTAYHFYRLLQRSSNVYLFYSNQVSETGDGEKSRYILQIENELAKLNSNMKIEYVQYQSNLEPKQLKEIVVEKSDTILEIIHQKYVNVDITNGDAGKGFSASGLSTYIYCPLKFYFEQIAKIRSDEDLIGINPMVFGRILHKTMELIYSGQKSLTPDFFNKVISQIEYYVDQATSLEYSSRELYGNDYLLIKVIEELVGKIIAIDKETPTLQILNLEEKFSFVHPLKEGEQILIKGIFDRLDFTNNTIRILDYKTGSGNVSIPKDVSSVFTNSDNKIVFQLLLYVYILSKTSPEKNNTLFNNKTVIAGAYMLKKNVKSISFLNKGEPIEQSVLDEFENGLNQLLHTILSPSIPFTQTDDLRKCSYCDFKNICNR